MLKKCLEIFQDPSRTFSGDESGFQLCPKTGKILACKGDRNVFELDEGPANVSITAMFAFSSYGLVCPPMVIYPYQRILSEITKTVSDDWGVGHSTTGWMTAEVFSECIGCIFTPHFEKHNAQFPVILFVNSHHTHLIHELSELCSVLRIILISLNPNTTRLFQPQDVTTFRPQKMGWKIAVIEWHRQKSDKLYTENSLTFFLGGALKKYDLECSATQDFRVSGFYPCDPENKDFSKCFGKKNSSTPSVNPILVITYKMFEEIV
jgi:hypothetical protein